MQKFTNRVALIALAFSVALFGQPGIASAQVVTITVNGQVVSFDQPPIERAGRVFVPLRGVFERLGASVVYSNGLINASGNGRNISLHIGSTTATVNGQAVAIDVAPFLVGPRTMVPLRFVAQALGATVNWNAANRSVAIYSSGGGGGGGVNPAPQPPPQPSGLRLVGRIPEANSTTPAAQPNVSAQFTEPVDPNSLRIYFDDRDVTSQSYANETNFNFTPQYSVPPGTHSVRVTGTTQAGVSFSRQWSFTSTAGVTNFINALNPPPGSRVGGSFLLTGRTAPGSTVTVTATGQALLGHIFSVGTGTFHDQTTADGSGGFALQVNVNAVPGGNIQVLIQSLAPNGASTSRTVNYPT
ncbi:MAG: copper amine oxidase N-terminal domain-containing protein [Candidatus Eremiobacteraeota bacterium]|nr:copper amine oxidase N-terminal domain-containing protein [Candidatus Eremiobacteraeota bacterium]